MVNKKRGVKKKEGLKLEINLTNRWLYTLILVFSLAIVGVVVYASDHGVSHSADEITGTLNVEQIPTLSTGKVDFANQNLSTGSDVGFNKVTSSNFCIGTDCINEWPSGNDGESLWSESGSDIYYEGGNVEIRNSNRLLVDELRPFNVETDNETVNLISLRAGNEQNNFLRLRGGGSVPNHAGIQFSMYDTRNFRMFVDGRDLRIDYDTNHTNFPGNNVFKLSNTGDLEIGGDLTVDGNIINDKGTILNGLVFCSGGISGSENNFVCNNPYVRIIESLSGYGGLSTLSLPVVYNTVDLEYVCMSLGGKYVSAPHGDSVPDAISIHHSAEFGEPLEDPYWQKYDLGNAHSVMIINSVTCSPVG